jgi:hypothetical protein
MKSDSKDGHKLLNQQAFSDLICHKFYGNVCVNTIYPFLRFIANLLLLSSFKNKL